MWNGGGGCGDGAGDAAAAAVVDDVVVLHWIFVEITFFYVIILFIAWYSILITVIHEKVRIITFKITALLVGWLDGVDGQSDMEKQNCHI